MATADRIPAEVFPPGEFILEELEERGWTQSDLAEIMGRDTATVSAIVTGKRGVTPETAQGLGAAFGTSAAFWLNLDSAYQLSKVDRDEAIVRRSRLFSRAPIQHMMRRGWIRQTDDVTSLEADFSRFFRLATLEDQPRHIAHAARKASSYSNVSPEELAWLYRSDHMARMIDSAKFTAQRLDVALDKLRALLPSPEEIRRVPSILRDAGVRLLVVEKPPRTKVDGACFWLNNTSPVVVLSLRYDRIDWFWFTLMHELSHVMQRDEGVLDTDFDEVGADDSRPEEEQRADGFAAEFLIPQDELRDFVMRIQPFFSKVKIRGFANRLKVHPGLVVGQLQRRKLISYSHNREMLVRVREILSATALTDGWGDVAAA